MKNTNIRLLVWVGVILLLIIFWFFINKNSSSTVSTTNASSTAMVATSSTNTSVSNANKITATKTNIIADSGFAGTCNFIVTSPKPGTSVTFPLTIQGLINEASHTGCSWSENAARAGSVILSYDTNNTWKVPGVSVPISVNGSLETTSTLAFSTQLNLQTAILGLKSGTPIKLTFTELNVNNKLNPNTFDLILYLK